MVITDTWTLVWAAEESAEYGVRNAEGDGDPAQFMLGKEENIQENAAGQPAIGEQKGGASEPPLDAALEIDG